MVGMAFLFRADASPRIGTGHVMRCLALAEELGSRGHRCHFLLGEATSAIERRLAAQGIAVTLLEQSADDRMGKATRDLAAGIGARAIVVDGYHFDEGWRLGVRRSGRPVLSFLDDQAVAARHADIVVNAAGDAAAIPQWQADGETFCLFGNDYVLLRREFRDALREPSLAITARPRLLVSFGGADAGGLSVPVAGLLGARLLPGTTIDVILGGSVAEGGKLARALAELGPSIRVHRDPPHLGALMRDAGLAVSAAGGTLWELAALAVPTLAVIVSDNQAPGAGRAAAVGWCRAVDARGEGAVEAIVAAAMRLWQDPALRQEMARKASGLVDGRGAERICDALLARVARDD